MKKINDLTNEKRVEVINNAIKLSEKGNCYLFLQTNETIATIFKNKVTKEEDFFTGWFDEFVATEEEFKEYIEKQDFTINFEKAQIGYKVLQNCIQAIWIGKEIDELSDLDDDYFFESEYFGFSEKEEIEQAFKEFNALEE